MRILARISLVLLIAFFGITVISFFWNPASYWSGQEARDEISRMTSGCSNGGSPRGVSADAWQTQTIRWFELSLSEGELACMREKSQLALCKRGCDAGLEWIKSPPSWFQAKGKAYSFIAPFHGRESGGCLWQSASKEGMYILQILRGNKSCSEIVDQ